MKSLLLIESQEDLEPRRQLFLKSLQENGYKIKVIFWDRSGNNPEREVKDGILFERVKVRGNYADVKSAYKVPHVYYKFFTKMIREKFDVLVCGHFFLLPLGVIVGKIRKGKVVYDVMEYYIHDFFMRLPKGLRWLANAAYLIENLLVKMCDGVVTVPSYQECYSKRYNKYNSNVAVIKNVPEITNDNNLNVKEPNEIKQKYQDRKIIIYVGLLCEQWGTLKLLESLVIIRNIFPEVILLIIGNSIRGYDKITSKFIGDNDLSHHVDLVGTVPYPKLLEYLSMSHVGVVPIQPYDRFELITKGNFRKIFEYMKAGLPLVAPNFGEISLAVKEEKCGILVDTSKPQQIADAVIYLLKNPDIAKKMGERGRKTVKEKYNWQIESKKLLEVFDNLWR